MALAIERDEWGFNLVHPDWNGETVRCCDVYQCPNSEPWHRMRRNGDVMLCDEHFDDDEYEEAARLEGEEEGA